MGNSKGRRDNSTISSHIKKQISVPPNEIRLKCQILGDYYPSSFDENKQTFEIGRLTLKEQRAYYCRHHLQADPHMCGPGHFTVGQEDYSIGQPFRERGRNHASHLKVFPNSKQKHPKKLLLFILKSFKTYRKVAEMY